MSHRVPQTLNWNIALKLLFVQCSKSWVKSPQSPPSRIAANITPDKKLVASFKGCIFGKLIILDFYKVPYPQTTRGPLVPNDLLGPSSKHGSLIEGIVLARIKGSQLQRKVLLSQFLILFIICILIWAPQSIYTQVKIGFKDGLSIKYLVHQTIL